MKTTITAEEKPKPLYWLAWTNNLRSHNDLYVMHATDMRLPGNRTLCGHTIQETAGLEIPAEGEPSCKICTRILTKRGILTPP